MKLDRKLQYNILMSLQGVYPDSKLVDTLPGYTFDSSFMGNLFYLQEHKFIAGDDIREPGQCRSMVDVQITKDGLDFLADDGGNQAILSDATVSIQKTELIEAVQNNQIVLTLTKEEKKILNERLVLIDKIQIKQLLLDLLLKANGDDILSMLDKYVGEKQ